MAYLEPYLGRGRLPVLGSVSLALAIETNRDIIGRMAWSLVVDDAYGHDRFSMVAAVLKQISLRASKGKRFTLEEKQVLRNVTADTDDDTHCGNLITRIALAVGPSKATLRRTTYPPSRLSQQRISPMFQDFWTAPSPWLRSSMVPHSCMG